MPTILHSDELIELMLLLDETFHYVKGGANKHLVQGLSDQIALLNSKLEVDDYVSKTIESKPDLSNLLLLMDSTTIQAGRDSSYSNELLCPYCGCERNHIITTLRAIKDRDEQVNEILIDGERVPYKHNYPFRSQGNLHILFACEDGHFYIKSFDGHKGTVFVDDNNPIKMLAIHLNFSYTPEFLTVNLDDRLFQYIKQYFMNPITRGIK